MDVQYNAVNNELKGYHCHTEMYLLYKLTGGSESNVKNALKGYKLLVDKPICKDCWEYVKLANPDVVEDTIGKKDEGHDELYKHWYNPFTGKTKHNKI